MNALRRWLVRCAATLGFVVLLITLTPLVELWARFLAGNQWDAKGSVLIVLSGSALDQGILGENTYGRCVYTVMAFQEGGIDHIVLTGTGSKGVSTAALMKDFLIAHKIPPSKIIVEGDSTTTLENARNVAPIVAALDGQKVLLTSDLHMYRAIKVFQKAGISVRPRPFPEALKRAASWRGRWPVFFDLAEETGKIAYYRWNGWI